MRIIFTLLMFLWIPQLLGAASAPVEVTAPGNRQYQLAVQVPASPDSALAGIYQELGNVLTFDINLAGVATAVQRTAGSPATGSEISAAEYDAWKNSGQDLLLTMAGTSKGADLTLEFRLYDLTVRRMLTGRRYLGKTGDVRRLAHSFADEILLSLTGKRGCFTSRIAYVAGTKGKKEIMLADWDGHNPRPMTHNGSININPDLSPNGAELIFTSYKRGTADLYRRYLSQPQDLLLSRFKGLNMTGAWSPDGSKIALALSKDGNTEIYTINPDGSSPQRLTRNGAIDIAPSWSPDGRQIAFVSDRLGKPQVFIMDAAGGNQRRLTQAGAYNVSPRWSPDGGKIVYARMTGGAFQVFSINADGTGDTQLTSSGSNENPAWSPDGRFIIFSSRQGSAGILQVIRADGSGITALQRGKGSATQPCWGH